MADMTEVFQLDKSNFPTREVIKVVGVGGAGNNALNHIIRGGLNGVEFIAANTDMAHLELSEAQNRIILGKELTKGLGAGSDPEIGFKSAQESREEIRAAVEGSDMVFIAAGMGGGTGTGAAPVIASIAKEADALVVAVVTLPFSFEGKRRICQANLGISQMRDKVDALIIIPNDRLLSVTEKKTTINDAFRIADGVLHQAVQGVTDLILRPGLVNVDFADVRTIMSNAGSAIMGIGEGYGEKRAATAAYNAINSPLMDTNMSGAKGILFNITGGANVGIHEINEATRIITEAADENAFIIWGHVFDPEMDDSIQITVIATGFDNQTRREATPDPAVSRKVDISAVKHLNAFSSSRGIQQSQPLQTAESAEKSPAAVKVISVSAKDQPVEKTSEIRAENFTGIVRRTANEEIRAANPISPVVEHDTPAVTRTQKTLTHQPSQPQDEDMFKGSGAPLDQFDVPAYLRRRR